MFLEEFELEDFPFDMQEYHLQVRDLARISLSFLNFSSDIPHILSRLSFLSRVSRVLHSSRRCRTARLRTTKASATRSTGRPCLLQPIATATKLRSSPLMLGLIVDLIWGLIVCIYVLREQVLIPVASCPVPFLRRNFSTFNYSNFNMQNEWTLAHGVDGGIRQIDQRFIVDVQPDDGSGETDPKISSHSPPRPLDASPQAIYHRTSELQAFFLTDCLWR